MLEIKLVVVGRGGAGESVPTCLLVLSFFFLKGFFRLASVKAHNCSCSSGPLFVDALAVAD
jgi:hypothetical protein